MSRLPLALLLSFLRINAAYVLALLWIVVVEVPLKARGIAADWARRGGRAPRTPPYVVANAVAAGFFVYLWASAIGLLTTSVFTWSMLQQPLSIASDPTWFYWPILVGGAMLVAVVAALWPRPLAADVRVDDPPTGDHAPRSAAVTLLRQALAALGLSLLAGALMTGWAEAAVVVAGFLIAGPGLTLVLGNLPAHARLNAASVGARWAVAIVFTAAVTFLITKVFWDALNVTSNLGFALVVAIDVCAFRFVLDLGRPAPWAHDS